MNFISMFSGIEAASAAWGPLGWQAMALAEIEAFPSAVLAHHYPDVPNIGDMTAHEWSQYRGSCDVVVGGPPCQAFSVAGLRRSLDDDRGNLSMQYMRAIHAIDPEWSVTENVPGWLSTKDNAFGCFLAGLVGEDAELLPPGGKWTDAGVASGPERTAAWRVLDAQYFGLAQRRRVFVLSVRGSGDWRPAAALFPVGESLSGNPPPRREKGQGFAADVAGSLTASGRGVERTGESRGQDPVIAVAGTLNANGKAAGSATQQDAEAGLLIPVAYGGNNTAGPIDIATAVRAKGGTGHGDFESETFIAHTLKGEGFDASEDGTGRGVPLVATPIDMRQASRGEKMTNNRRGGSSGGAPGTGIGEAGDPSPTIAASHIPAIAFSSKDNGRDATEEMAPTLRAMGHSGSHANAGGQLAVAFNPQAGGKQTSLGYDPDRSTTGTLEANQIPAVAGSAVRRLTPRECERLQGFPDDYTLISYRGKPAADGPRYKALGNSMAVPVMRWIGERIELVQGLMADGKSGESEAA